MRVAPLRYNDWRIWTWRLLICALCALVSLSQNTLTPPQLLVSFVKEFITATRLLILALLSQLLACFFSSYQDAGVMHSVVMRWLLIGQQCAQIHLHLGDTLVRCDARESVIDPNLNLPHECAGHILVRSSSSPSSLSALKRPRSSLHTVHLPSLTYFF